MNVLPLAPRALVKQLIVGLGALGRVSKDCKPMKGWATNLHNPYPPFHLLRLHVPKGDLLLSTLLLAGASPEDAFEGNLWRSGKRESEGRIVDGPESCSSRSHGRDNYCRNGLAIIDEMKKKI